MAKLFFSYSHKDKDLRDQLEVHLAMLKRQGVIEVWHDRLIGAGAVFDDAILAQIEEADIILLLLSPDFLASDYCFEREMSRALERHRAGTARVIPVILRPCDRRPPPHDGLLAAPPARTPITKWPDLDDAFQDVAKAIRRAAEEMGTRPAPKTVMAASPRAAAPGGGPRSSNLRVRRQFSDADRDAFIEDSFEFMARFFENSTEELEKRNPGIEGRFRKIDARHFTAAAYRDGRKVAKCRIWLGGLGTNGIAYAHDDNGTDNSLNECLSVEETEQALVLKPLGMAYGYSGSGDRKNLTQEGAAELYWAIFIAPLQR